MLKSLDFLKLPELPKLHSWLLPFSFRASEYISQVSNKFQSNEISHLEIFLPLGNKVITFRQFATKNLS